jgi:hypothetical protein
MPEREREQQVPPDPSGIEEPHDVLAAEEFGMPARDERIPRDPTGISEPHDVLAAEEFAMPSGEDRPRHEDARARGRALPVAALLLAALVIAAFLRRRR